MPPSNHTGPPNGRLASPGGRAVLLWGSALLLLAGLAAVVLFAGAGPDDPAAGGPVGDGPTSGEDPAPVGAEPAGTAAAGGGAAALLPDASVADLEWEAERARAIAEGRPFPARYQIPAPPTDLPPPEHPEPAREMTPAEEAEARGRGLELLGETERRLERELAQARRAGDEAAAHRLALRLQRLEAIRERRQREMGELEAAPAQGGGESHP